MLMQIKSVRQAPWYDLAKAALKDRGLIYDDVARELDITVSAVGHYLAGRREPSLLQVKTIADMVGKSISELCGEGAYFVTKADEQRLLDTFRDMTEKEQEIALKMLSAVPTQTPSK